jgi:hypothetical protein
LDKQPVDVFWGEMSACEHFVQIYDDDNAFIDTLENFIRSGLGKGDACVVIATQAHLQVLGQRLLAGGLDVDALCARDCYMPLDAEKILAKFMINGFPDDRLFNRAVSDILTRAKGEGARKVRAFGEMVAVLWERGEQGAALQIEHFWDDLCRAQSFSLYCAYPKQGFSKNASQSIRQICALHSKVIGA